MGVTQKAILTPLGRNQVAKIGTSIRLLYLPRGKGVKRSVANEDEMLYQIRDKFTQAANFEVVVANLTNNWKEDRALMEQADVIFGPHGGAMSNMVFAKKAISVVEFIPLGHLHRSNQNARPCYLGLATALNFSYYNVEPDDTDKNSFTHFFEQPMRMNFEKVLSTLEEAVRVAQVTAHIRRSTPVHHDHHHDHHDHNAVPPHQLQAEADPALGGTALSHRGSLQLPHEESPEPPPPHARRSKGWKEVCESTLKTNKSFGSFADKHAVKDWVQTKHVKAPQTYLVVQDESDITLAKFEQLPSNFVMKATQGSGMTVIANGTDYACHALWAEMHWCPAGDTNAGNSKEARLTFLQKTCKKWLSVDFGKLGGEVFYSQITPKCIFEEFIAQDDDYKIFMIHGTPMFVQVDRSRFTGHRRSYYTPSWDHLHIKTADSPDSLGVNDEVPKPAYLSQLIKTAVTLGADFPFVRVDLYINGGDVFFSELTGSPWNCRYKFEPDSVDAFLGRLISEPHARRVPEDLLSLVSQTHVSRDLHGALLEAVQGAL